MAHRPGHPSASVGVVGGSVPCPCDDLMFLLFFKERFFPILEVDYLKINKKGVNKEKLPVPHVSSTAVNIPRASFRNSVQRADIFKR